MLTTFDFLTKNGDTFFLLPKEGEKEEVEPRGRMSEEEQSYYTKEEDEKSS